MMIAGIVLTGVGALSIITGGVLVSGAQEDCSYYSGYSSSCGRSSDDQELAGAVLMIVGGATTAVGIPLIVVGGAKVPAKGAAPTDAPPAWESARLVVGPRSTGVRFAF